MLDDNRDGARAAASIDRMIPRISLRRAAEPEDIAGVVCFLAGPDAADMTGQVLSASGGGAHHGVNSPRLKPRVPFAKTETVRASAECSRPS